MNSSNYGYPRSGYTPPYASSTPSSMRSNRPRFGYTGPSLYPRPRSSASKPNPDSFSDSMINNYGNSTSRIDTSFGSENGNTYDDDSYKNSSANYYSANDTVYSEPLYPADSSGMRGNMGMRNSLAPPSDMYSAGAYANTPGQYGVASYNYNTSSYGMNNEAEQLKGAVQKALVSSFGFTNRKQTFQAKKFGKAKKKMASKLGNWKCIVCNLDFTSQIPYDMHLRGARHARKLKSKDASSVVQAKATVGSTGEKQYFCELCNVTTNSLLQYQTHLDGNKHKNKLNPKDPSQTDKKDAPKRAKAAANASLSGKTNGSVTRPLPAEFGEPQPAKLTKFSCDICTISVNSAVQLEQHMASKKHQNKVEGKPIVKGKKKKKGDKKNAMEVDTVMANDETTAASNDTAKTVVGVKTLSSSFVQGETLQ